jgi:hypothetical protein
MSCKRKGKLFFNLGITYETFRKEKVVPEFFRGNNVFAQGLEIDG